MNRRRWIELMRTSWVLMMVAILGLAGCNNDDSPAPRTLQSVQITPAQPSVVAGLTSQLSLTAAYSDNTTEPVTSGATWSSADTAIATIDAATGAVQGKTTGTSNVTASFSGKTANVTLTVTPATLVSIAIAPSTPHIAIGATQKFTATGTYTDNSTADLTESVTWASSAAGVAQISNTAGSNGVASAAGSTTLGSTTTISAQSGSITGSVTLPVDATGYAYVVGYGNNQILQFHTLVDGSLSALTQSQVATGAVPYSMAVDRTRHRAYVVNQHDETISQYTIGSDGSLVPMSIATVAAPVGAQYMAVDPNGRYAYATGFGSATAASVISQYSIGSDGALSPMGPATVSTVRVHGMVAVDPTGQYVYVVSGSVVSQFTIGATGELVEMSPATVPAGFTPFSLAVNAAGTTLHVVEASGGPGTGDTAGNILQFSIGAGGALTAVATPVVAASNYPSELTLHPNGQYAYIPNFNGNSVSQYAVAGDGTFTPMTIPTVAAGRTPSSAAVDPSGKYLYVTNSNGNTLSTYSIGTDGALTQLTEQPITGAFPFQVVTVAVQ